MSVAVSGIDEIRAQLDASIATLTADPHARFTPEDAGGIPAEWTDAPASRAPQTVLYLHGGGYVWGSPATHRSLTAKLASATAARVLALDYRLAPEHPFPAALHDTVAGYGWLLDRGTRPGEVAVCGDSAGGGLAMGLLVALRERGLPMPSCAVVFSPWADLTGESETYVTRASADPIIDPIGARENAALYLAGADPHDPRASPVLADLSGLPPVLMQVGDDELLLGDSQKLELGLRTAGGSVTLSIWRDMFHVFQMFHASIPEAAEALSEAAAFIGRHWASRAE